LPDAWELRHFGYTGVDLYADPNGNGVSNWLEYLEGTDPNFDFYQGVIPILEVVSGSDGQDAVPGGFLPLPLKVRVLRPDLSAWPEAPVRFVATSEEGLLANEPLSTARLAPALTVYTDADGYAQVWLKCP
jgi:hypothetical protein